jgi:hypothetical protein
MAKKEGEKKEEVEKKSVYSRQKKMSNREIEEALIENFVSMQKVMSNLALKFETLSGNIAKLLELFETAAKNFTEKYEGGEFSDKDFLKKLDALLEQNKVISKGIMIMEERIRNKSPYPPNQPMQDPRFNRPAY